MIWLDVGEVLTQKWPLCDVVCDVIDVRVHNSADSSVMWKEYGENVLQET